MKRIVALLLVVMMVLSLAACGKKDTAEGPSVTFTLTVTDLEGNEKQFEVTTTETTVGAALLNEGLIAGEDSEYGLYVTTVDGVTADYDADQTYWAFYINGEYAMTGVDSTEINAGDAYALVLTKG